MGGLRQEKAARPALEGQGAWERRVQGARTPPARPGPSAYFSLLARRRYSPTVMAFFWMLYCVKRPDWPVTTCWMGAGMTTSSMSSYVCLGFHSFGGMICEMKMKSQRRLRTWPQDTGPSPRRPAAAPWGHVQATHSRGTWNLLCTLTLTPPPPPQLRTPGPGHWKR